jgi:hypothetical protein
MNVIIVKPKKQVVHPTLASAIIVCLNSLVAVGVLRFGYGHHCSDETAAGKTFVVVAVRCLAFAVARCSRECCPRRVWKLRSNRNVQHVALRMILATRDIRNRFEFRNKRRRNLELAFQRGFPFRRPRQPVFRPSSCVARAVCVA